MTEIDVSVYTLAAKGRVPSAHDNLLVEFIAWKPPDRSFRQRYATFRRHRSAPDVTALYTLPRRQHMQRYGRAATTVCCTERFYCRPASQFLKQAVRGPHAIPKYIISTLTDLLGYRKIRTQSWPLMKLQSERWSICIERIVYTGCFFNEYKLKAAVL